MKAIISLPRNGLALSLVGITPATYHLTVTLRLKF